MANGPVPLATDEGIPPRVQRHMRRVMVAGRWIMAPVYFGLLAGLVLDVIKFFQKLVLAFPLILSMDTSEAILTVLTLIDLSLVGNLVIIVIFAGWENFVAPSSISALAGGGFSAVKQKLIGSVAAIAAIQILETFVHIEAVKKEDAMWQLAILLGIAVTGVLLALMDRLAEHEH